MSLYRYLIELFRDLRHPRDIYGCFLLFFKVAFPFGLIPFHISNKRELSISFFGYVSMIGRLIAFDFCFFYNYCHERLMVSYFFQTNVSNNAASSQKFNGMLALNLIIGICFIKRRLFKSLIVQFQNLESRLLNIGVEINQVAAAIRINIVLILVAISNYTYTYFTLYGILAKNGYYISLTTVISFYAPNYIGSGILMLFCGVLFKITTYFCAINKVLKALGKQMDQKYLKATSNQQSASKYIDSFSIYTIVTKSPCDIVRECMEIHQLICEAANRANKYFTYQLLTVISIAFFVIVFNAYYVLETLLSKSKRESKFKTIEFVTFFSYQMILYAIVIISIVEASNRTIKQFQKTGGIVHGLLHKTKDYETKEKLHQFSAQLLHLKVNFTAAGLFNVDRTLYFTICGALTTYLIILLQVSASTYADSVHKNQLTQANGLVNVTISV